jgi:predicted nucleic acid-binding protein
MTEVFADTSYWMAALNARDQLHAKAIAWMSEPSSVRIVTSEMVFTELLNNSGHDRYLRSATVELVEEFRSDGSVTVIVQTAAQFDEALRLYKRASDKSWSLTDCASFLIMETREIRAALTYDHHFVQAGFEALLR